MVCETCKGKGVIELFTSTVACDACGGSGEKLVGTFTINDTVDVEFTIKGADPSRAAQDLIRQLQADLNQRLPLEVCCATENRNGYYDRDHSVQFAPGGSYTKRAYLKTVEQFIDYFQQFNQFYWTARHYYCDRRYFTLSGIAQSDYFYHSISISGLESCDPLIEAIEKVINAKTE